MVGGVARQYELAVIAETLSPRNAPRRPASKQRLVTLNDVIEMFLGCLELLL